MRQDKQFVFELRKQGKSYREIQLELGISRSTLCDWFKNIEWSKHIKHKNNDNNVALSKERLEKLNHGRKIKLDLYYQNAEQEAEIEFELFKNEPLFIAGLMIYAGEGDKRNRNNTRVSNSEFYLHQITIKFAEKYLGIERKMIKFGLLLYPDNDIKECVNIWQKELGISINNFHKVHTIQGKETKRRLQYGVGSSIISSKVVIKKKILVWLELSKTLF